MKNQTKNRNAGFTIVEMLVTLAIISILAGMISVVLIYATHISRQIACKGNLMEIGKTINLMAQGAGGAVPALEDDNGIPWWANVYKQWGGITRLDTDPATNGLQLPPKLPRQMEIFHCRYGGALDRSSAAGLGNSISYGLNFDVMDSDDDLYHDSINVDPYSVRFPDTLTIADKDADTYYLTQIMHPAEFILLSEANTGNVDETGDGAMDWTGGRISMSAITRGAADDPAGNAPIVGRHDGRANVLFADLHVEALKVLEGILNTQTELWTLPDD